MSRVELGLVIGLATFAFAFILGAVMALNDKTSTEVTIEVGDIEPTGVIFFLKTLGSAVTRTIQWAPEDRPILILFWTGVTCAIGAIAIVVS